MGKAAGVECRAVPSSVRGHQVYGAPAARRFTASDQRERAAFFINVFAASGARYQRAPEREKRCLT